MGKSDIFYLKPAHGYPHWTRHSLPAELPKLAPRSLSEVGQCGCMTILGLLGIFLFIFYILQLITMVRFALNGVDTVALITACEIAALSTTHEFTYTYDVDGISFEDTHLISPDDKTCSDFPMGRSVSIQYLENEHSESRVTEADANRSHIASVLFYTSIPFALSLMVYLGSLLPLKWLNRRRKLAKYQRIIKSGRALHGEIIDASYKSHSGMLSLAYRFTTPDGRELTRKAQKVRHDLDNKSLPAPGTPVQILYADDRAFVLL